MDKQLILNEIIKYKGFKSDAEFAKFLGISPQNLSKWKSRNTYDIDILYTKIPEISPEWLLTGRGAMLKEAVHATQQHNDNELITLLKDKITLLEENKTLLQEKIAKLEANIKDLKLSQNKTAHQPVKSKQPVQPHR